MKLTAFGRGVIAFVVTVVVIGAFLVFKPKNEPKPAPEPVKATTTQVENGSEPVEKVEAEKKPETPVPAETATKGSDDPWSNLSTKESK